MTTYIYTYIYINVGKTGKKIKETKEADHEEIYSTLFIKNLNFNSDDDSLRGHIENLGIFIYI
jgi:RNA recognition motif-containing protein